MSYEWKQWKGYRKLHAVERWKGNGLIEATYVSVCGISSYGESVFVVPPISQIKCKNCERELFRMAVTHLATTHEVKLNE